MAKLQPGPRFGQVTHDDITKGADLLEKFGLKPRFDPSFFQKRQELLDWSFGF
jgi:hypothetical protein